MEFKNYDVKTQNLRIRSLMEEDIIPLAKLLYNKEISETYMVPELESLEEAIKLSTHIFENSKINPRLELVIMKNDSCIGFLNDCGYDSEKIEIGYAIDPTYKGHGYATEALQATIDYLFASGFKRVIAAYFEGNIASKRVMEKAGMKDINIEEEVEYRNQRIKCYFFGIEKTEWIKFIIY